MTVLDTPEAMRAWSLERRAEGKSIGLVPTMGALHEGHMSLIRAALDSNDVTVVSIFVNPAQFGPDENFNDYPRTYEADAKMCDGLEVDVIYAPRAMTMYKRNYATYVKVEGLTEGLCGRSRPKHFRGVTTVVAKLFNAALPDRAYFGQKDAQQCAVIRRMVRDLDLGVEAVEMPIVRDSDGLALSSRNAYLSPEERERALCLSRSLEKAHEMLEGGERDPNMIINTVREGMADVDIDYVELVDAEEIQPVVRIAGTILLAVAATVGETRLIDNIKYEVNEQ